MATVTINPSVINAWARDPSQPVVRHLSSLASRVAQRAPELARRRTGSLHSSIRVQFDQDAAGPIYRVLVDSPHAMVEEEGSKPHVIRPRNRAALHFFWERKGLETVVPQQGGFKTHIDRGGILFIGKGRVDHPGTTGTHFLSRALQQVIQGG